MGEALCTRAEVMCCLLWPLRGHARSHRIFTILKSCTVPVGAGVPAKGVRSAPNDLCITAKTPGPLCGPFATQRRSYRNRAVHEKQGTAISDRSPHSYPCAPAICRPAT
ncbi:hypothetical protein DBB42_10065 [Pseudomonas plecoglossicida]|uniref:Uncharacterized protein n=1 Tax=Pseudomonas plecoglossicida TaxID=70775 RepID=A0A2R7UJQ2_PSEDL|nr:hypothetical protein DBB42_10065 [Pseudomonas plecoglossicida]